MLVVWIAECYRFILLIEYVIDNEVLPHLICRSRKIYDRSS